MLFDRSAVNTVLEGITHRGKILLGCARDTLDLALVLFVTSTPACYAPLRFR